MPANHNNEPRDVGYTKEHAEYYQDKDGWLSKNSKSIFSGKYQKDLFIFSMALAKYRQKKSAVKPPKLSNVRVDAMTERQKWALLSIGIAQTGDLFCLKDEFPLYTDAEEYAYDGMKILVSHVEKWGINYPKALEAELKEILQGSS
jgi:hypothetical protein